MPLDHYTDSEAYWRHGQDISCDLVRQMARIHNWARGQPVSSRTVLVDLGPQTSAMYSVNMYIILFGRDTQTFLVHTRWFVIWIKSYSS